MPTTTLNLNGRPTPVQSDPSTPLLWVLRDELGLCGSKFGCGIAACGACTVHVDGQATRSCVLPIAAVGAQAVTTIEAVGEQGPAAAAGAAVRAAWIAHDVAQCGYCQSGQIMGATALLAANPQPSDAEIDAAMAGNVCRCGTYPRIRAAIHAAAKSLASQKKGA